MSTVQTKQRQPWSAGDIGMALGAIGMFIFAMTLPMTRLAVGTSDAPELDPYFVTAFRAAGAGILSVFFLAFTRAPIIARPQWPLLMVNALGTIIGFPLLLALALRNVEASHAAVITGILPLGTAIAAALYFRQRPSVAFWTWALVGTALIIAFVLFEGGGTLRSGDLFLLLAVVSASIGYVAGARLSSMISATIVICWGLVLCLPVTLAVSWWRWPPAPVSTVAWISMAYLSIFSMWLGFIAWYRGLVLGGVIRVSQIQLVQPFIALVLCWPLLNEAPDARTYLFMLAVIAVVFMGKRAPTAPPSPRSQ